MLNSPGPSTSKSPDFILSPGGKKRTRRRPRNKAQDETPTQSSNVSLFQSPARVPKTKKPRSKRKSEVTFKIANVSNPAGRAFRKRNENCPFINLKSFAKDTVPYVFETTANFLSTATIMQSFNNLSINEAPHVHLNKKNIHASLRQKRASDFLKKKKRNKNSTEQYKNYITQEEVESGLQSGQLIKGAIRLNPKNYKEAYVGNKDPTKPDYVIRDVVDRNRALDGDEVVVRLKEMEKVAQNCEAEVVFITKKTHTRLAVGFLIPIRHDKQYAEFQPRDRRLPRMRIPKISWPSNFAGQSDQYKDILLLAKIGDWNDVMQAEGTIVEILGLSKDLKIESLAILRELCLDPTPYGPEIAEFLPKITDIPPEEFVCREDIRNECIFTIDPASARDLDDAVSCKQLANGNFEIGVHISDASYYLPEGTKLDEIVQTKATTIYLVDSTYHMLPIELCMLCSLLPGKDKLAFSAFWEMTPSGDIVNKRIARTVINSCAQLSYEHAQMLIDRPTKIQKLPAIHNGFTGEDLSLVVNSLQKFAVILRDKRTQNGALRIDQAKIYFSIHPVSGEPLHFWPECRLEAHKLIEEFMLLANMTIADKLLESYPDLALLRLHEPPKLPMLEELQRSLETVGIHIDISSSGGIQASLLKYVTQDFVGQTRLAALCHLFAKPMMRARYFCVGAHEDDNFSHYALSVPFYTHFTSPIRRYADIMVHRLLAASLEYRERPTYTPEQIAEIAERCNIQKYHAKKAGDSSCDLFLAHYIERNQPVIQQAVVVDTRERSFDVLVLNTGNVVRIYTNNFEEGVVWESQEIQCGPSRSTDDEYLRKLWRIRVYFPATRTEPPGLMFLEIFAIVNVALTRRPNSNQLEAKLLRPPPLLHF